MSLIKPGNKYVVIGPYSRIDIVAALIALVIGVFVITADSEWIHKAIGIFGVVTVMIRVSSRIPFVLTLICIVSMPIVQIFGQKWLLEDLAVSAFYFLLTGIALLALESQASRKPTATITRVQGGVRSR